jgi:hypothetical protein
MVSPSHGTMDAMLEPLHEGIPVQQKYPDIQLHVGAPLRWWPWGKTIVK